MRCDKLTNPQMNKWCRREATHIGRFFWMVYCDAHKADSPNWVALDTEDGQRLLAKRITNELRNAV